MATLIGIILLALGLSLAVVWQTSVLDVLRGIIPLTLIFWGGLVVLIGYSEVKARREYRKAVGGDSEGAQAGEGRDARNNRGRYARNQTPPVATSTSPSAGTGSAPASTSQASPPNHTS